MNDFREWLSDNLRYFMLGFGILLLLLLIFFGIRFISGLVVDEKADTQQEEVQENIIEENPEVTPTPETTPVVSDELEQNAVPEVFTLISTYYNAISEKDVENIRGLVDNLTTEDETIITTNTVEAYSNINVYTRAHENGSYVTFVTYKYKLAGIGTMVPGMSQLLITPGDDGQYYICTATPDAEMQAFIDEAMKSAEVQGLAGTIQADLDEALANDATLYAYFYPEEAASEDTPSEDEAVTEETQEPEEPEPTPTPTPTPTPEPERVVLKSSANFRDAPSNNSNVIRGIVGGTEMVKLGEDGGWFHVGIDDPEHGYQEGYIAARFFR